MIMSMDLENKIKKIMSNVLKIKSARINSNTSTETINNWDSYTQMNLIVAIEEEFDVEFDDAEIIKMTEYDMIVSITKEKVYNVI